jgi:hypothetical protein
MANVYGVNYTKELAGIYPKDFLGPEWKGKVKVLTESYTCAALASGQTIGVGKLKKDSVFLDAIVSNAALGTSTTLSLGDASDAVRFMAATSTSSAGTQRILSTAAANKGIGYKYTADTEIILTVGGAAATGIIQVAIFYADAS